MLAKRTLVLFSLFLLIGLSITAPQQASANSCGELIQYYANQINAGKHLSYYLVTNSNVQSTGINVTSYAVGSLQYDSFGKLLWGSEGRQYFNDRLQDLGHRRYEPFDPDAIDQLGVTIKPDSSQIVLTLFSWNSVQMFFDMECWGNLFYGFDNTDFDDKSTDGYSRMVVISVRLY